MHPVLFEINGFAVSSYYFINILGAAAGFFVLFLNTRKYKKNIRMRIFLLVFAVFAVFIAGASAGAKIEELAGGGSIPRAGRIIPQFSLWWGFLAALLSLFPVASMLKLGAWEAADLAAPSVAMGGIFAKIGCLMYGCCFGIPCPPDAAASFFPEQSPAGGIFPDRALYPVQIYEALSWAFIFIALVLLKRVKTFRGELVVVEGILYSVLRFFLEFIRYHETARFPSAAQIWSVLFFIAGIILLFMLPALKAGKHSRQGIFSSRP